MIALWLASLAAAANPVWLEQAFVGRPGSKWTAVIVVDRPGSRGDLDTGKACRDGTSERLDLRHGSHFLAGDSTVFLENATQTAWVGTRRRFPVPPGARIEILRTEQFLGRSVVVAEIRGPRGRGRRLWVDTLLPLVLRSEGLDTASDGRHDPPERQFLSLRPGVPCPKSAFRIPAGWDVKVGHPPPPTGLDGRVDPHRRRHQVESAAALAQAVGFTPPDPPWLPPGFAARSWAWVDTRRGKAAQILFDNGSRKISIFFRPLGTDPRPECPPDGCKDHKGRAVYFGRVGNFGMAATGDLPPDQMEKVVGHRK